MTIRTIIKYMTDQKLVPTEEIAEKWIIKTIDRKKLSVEKLYQHIKRGTLC